MIQFLVPAIVILVALMIILIIVLRHFPQAASIDIDSLPAEQEAAMKAALMERRLQRKLLETKKKVVPFFRRFSGAFGRLWKNVHDRVVHMEQRHRKRPHLMSSEQQEEVKQKIRTLLQKARAYEHEDNTPEAEAKYIEVLSWDHKNLEAYFGLARIYFQRKQFPQAKETFMYLLKLHHAFEVGEDVPSKFSSLLTDAQLVEARYDYAVCLQIDKKYKAAMEQVRAILENDAKNPKFLDKLVELSILQKDRESARNAFEALKNVNPENQKLVSLEEQIRKI